MMKESRLKSKEEVKEEDKRLLNNQWNEIIKLNNKLKTHILKKEKLPKGNYIKIFWNYCKPYFSNKGICNDDRIMLVENDETVNKDFGISETFNNCFNNIPKDLKIFDKVDDF